MWGKEVLPLMYTKIAKKHAKHLFPRISGARAPPLLVAPPPGGGRLRCPLRCLNACSLLRPRAAVDDPGEPLQGRPGADKAKPPATMV